MHAMQMLLNKNYSTHLKSNKLHMFQMLKFCQKLLNPSHSDETNVRPIEEENDRYARHEKAISSIKGSFMSYSLLHTATSTLRRMDYFSNRLVSLKGVTFANVENLFQACLQSY